MTAVDVRHITKHFGAHAAVEDLSFTAAAGEVLALLGPNGSGKTTAIRCMLGLESGEGETTFNGRRYVDHLDPTTIVGALLDDVPMHPAMTVRRHLESVAMGTGVAPHRIDEVLDMVEMGGIGRIRPGALSLGMRRRIGIAVALLGDPSILILDEPANGLDPHGTRWLTGLLRRFADSGGTVIVSSHLLREVEIVADHVVVISSGTKVADQPLPMFLAEQTRDQVVIEFSDPDALAQCIIDAGGVISHRHHDTLVVEGITRLDVAHLAAACPGFVLELSTRRGSLEDAYLAAAGGAS